MANSPSTIFSISSPHNSRPTHVDAPKHQITPQLLPADSVSPSHFQRIIAEILGTYIFVFVSCGAALVDREKPLTVVGMAMAPAVSLMAMIYTVGHISGAHFNPAVTVAFAVARKLHLMHVPMYVLSQMCGSTLACLTLRLLYKEQSDFVPMLTQYSGSTTDVEAIVWEFILTFMLMLTICGVASDDRANNALCGVAIGGTLLFNGLVAGSITGASMNPARSLGPAIVAGVYKNQWVYVVAPILGAMAASLIYNLLLLPKQTKHTQDARAVYNDLYLHTEP